MIKTTNILFETILFFSILISLQSCRPAIAQSENIIANELSVKSEKPEYFLLRPEAEKAYGYSHAIQIGNNIKISGAVSMDDEGNPTAIDDLEQQMKNCYSDLDKTLKHYGSTFDDVVNEDIFTMDMQKLLEFISYRTGIYKNQFPKGSWLGVNELALPEFMIEIELEVHKSD